MNKKELDKSIEKLKEVFESIKGDDDCKDEALEIASSIVSLQKTAKDKPKKEKIGFDR